MTYRKKLWALLLSAALALALLAGCGGSRALSRVFVDLLEGQYQNLSVETDPKLEAALKKAVKAGGTQEEIYAALLENLGLAGKAISFSYSSFDGAGVGEQAVALTFLPGEDETAAARSALNGWSSVLGRLPKEGRYTAGLTMVQAEGGYYAAVRLTVTRAGRDDDDPDPDYTYNEATKTYTVYTAKGLKAWAEDAAKNLDLNCTLASDITLSGEWTPIGSDEDHAYKGDFDGGGHTITGLTANTSSSYAGLFGYIGKGGKVQDLTLENVNISVTGTNNNYVGGVVGWNDGTITGCSSSAAVTGIYNVGGVAGYNNGTLADCWSTGSVSGTGSYVGGVVGSNNSTSTITACYWDNNQSNGIGSGGGDVTQVTGTTTWGTAQNAMNTALAGCGWSYENGSGDQPLILKKIGG